MLARPDEPLVRLDHFTEPLSDVELDACLALLSDDELARYRRYLRPGDRDTFARSHALVRRTLAPLCGLEPDRLRFATNRHGRPEIANPGVAPDLRFNLSHTDGLIALLVHGAADAGLDVELMNPLDDIGELARTVFAPPELDWLKAAPAGQTLAVFYRIWTLKEAYIKARGMGLALPLSDFWFSETSPGDISFACVDGLDPSPDSWRFSTETMASGHALSTARRI